MKNTTQQSLFLLLVLLVLSACKPKKQATTIEETPATNLHTVAPSKVEDVEAAPLKVSPMKHAKVTAQKNIATKASQFRSLGCCAAKRPKKKDDCCCKLVLEKYKRLRQEPEDLAHIKATDPIFNQCKEVMYNAFNCIDYPEDCDQTHPQINNEDLI